MTLVQYCYIMEISFTLSQVMFTFLDKRIAILFILITLIICQFQIQTSCFFKFSFRKLRNFLLLERNSFYISSIRNVLSLTLYHNIQFRKFLNNPLHQKHVKTYFQNIFLIFRTPFLCVSKLLLNEHVDKHY